MKVIPETLNYISTFLLYDRKHFVVILCYGTVIIVIAIVIR